MGHTGAGGDPLSQHAINLQLCERVDEAAPGQVHHEVEMAENISTKDGVFDVSEEKNPPKCSTEPHVEGAGDGAEGRNVRVVNRLEWGPCR